ncbi:MAG: cation:proton antiporter [Lactobacillaceae bacterium]|jgi:Kef-type K+ transport system membrane component KefB|nr:cation:proton antiporter [Lactobacillaceae bacterium]
MEIIDIIIVVIIAIFGGLVAKKIGFPAVVGQLIAGVILGPVMPLYVVHGSDLMHFFAEIGVYLLMLMAGLETDMRLLQRNIKPAAWVAILGVILPFAVFTGVGLVITDLNTALFWGIVFAATSISITIAVLGEFGALGSRAGSVVLGAAVLDDIFAMAMVAIYALFASTSGMGVTTLLPLLFFALGVILTRFEKLNFHKLEQLGNWTVIPLFFGSLGLEVSLHNIQNTWLLIIILSLFALLTKYLGALAGVWLGGLPKSDWQVVSLGMIPRGEMALIIAQIGLSASIINQATFSEMAIVIIISTIIPPVLLRRALLHR